MTSKSEKARQRAERAKQLAEQERLKAKRGMILKVAGVAVAMVLIVVAFVAIGQATGGGDGGDGGGGGMPAAGQSEHGLVVGEADAPHKVVIYEDFLCPYCGELERETGDDLQQLADQGKVQVDYRPFVLLDQVGPYSELATNAFAVVKQESGDAVAKKFHDLLFENQPSESGPFPEAEELVDLAVEAGAQESAVGDGIRDLSEKDWTKGATQEAADAGVQGTPTVFLDGEEFRDGSSAVDLGKNLVEAVS